MGTPGAQGAALCGCALSAAAVQRGSRGRCYIEQIEVILHNHLHSYGHWKSTWSAVACCAADPRPCDRASRLKL